MTLLTCEEKFNIKLCYPILNIFFRSLHMQSTDEVLPVEQSRSLTSTEQQSFSCSVSYFSLPSKTYLCNQVGDSILCLPSRVSCGEDSLNPNNRDSDQCLGGSNEGRY